jgi:hypothetical protein
MALGAGKYDYICTAAREMAKADGALVIILGGEIGSGFSVQADFATQLKLPDMLEMMAKQIRSDLEAGQL